MENIAGSIVEYSTPFLAEEALGFQVAAPESLLSSIEKSAVVDGKMLILTMRGGLEYRMAQGKEDISRTDVKYPEQHERSFGLYTVIEKSCAGKLLAGSWTNGEWTFALHTLYGITSSRLGELISELRPLDYLYDQDPPNAVIYYDSVFEAECGMGRQVRVPANIHKCKRNQICVIDGKVLEIFFGDSMVYRAAEGLLDISGIYREYEVKKCLGVGQWHVLAKGEKDCYHQAFWNDGQNSYSLYAPNGISQNDLETMIRSML